MYIIIPIVLVVLVSICWYAVKNVNSSKKQEVSSCPIFLNGPDQCLNKVSKINSIAKNAKGGAVVVADDGSLIYLKNVVAWPENMLGKKVSVTGLLKKEQYLPVATTDLNGAVSQGATEKQLDLVLEDAKFELSK